MFNSHLPILSISGINHPNRDSMTLVELAKFLQHIQYMAVKINFFLYSVCKNS